MNSPKLYRGGKTKVWLPVSKRMIRVECADDADRAIWRDLGRADEIKNWIPVRRSAPAPKLPKMLPPVEVSG